MLLESCSISSDAVVLVVVVVVLVLVVNVVGVNNAACDDGLDVVDSAVCYFVLLFCRSFFSVETQNDFSARTKHSKARGGRERERETILLWNP